VSSTTTRGPNATGVGPHTPRCHVARSILRCFIGSFLMLHGVIRDVSSYAIRCCIKWFEMFHYCFEDVARFIFRVSSATLTCCDICILMFRCDLANVANVEFRWGGEEDYWCWMLHTTHVATWVAWVLFQEVGGMRPADVWMLHATCSQHVSQWLATCSQHGLLHFSIRRLMGWVALNPTTTEASDASARNGRPSASSSVIFIQSFTWSGWWWWRHRIVSVFVSEYRRIAYLYPYLSICAT
jgi:hypothetical protein